MFFAAAFSVCAQQSAGSAFFDWSNPQKLSPRPYAKPTADEPFTGEYISNVIFENNGTAFTVHDEEFAQQSPARFYFSYLTEAVELRANYGSVISVTCPAGYVITAVAWNGAKIGKNYLRAVDSSDMKSPSEGSWGDGYTWRPDSPARSCCFLIESNINCSSTRVAYAPDSSGADDIIADAASSAPAEYLTLSGLSLGHGRPTAPGLYLCRRGNAVVKILIR